MNVCEMNWETPGVEPRHHQCMKAHGHTQGNPKDYHYCPCGEMTNLGMSELWANAAEMNKKARREV